MNSVYMRVYVHRNAQQQSSNKSHPIEDDYVTPDRIRPDQQPQYDVIQLGHTQHGPADDPYAELNPETQGHEPQYDVISPRETTRDEEDYVDVTHA